jgi:O-antigen/teichoic acid export membrane protein
VASTPTAPPAATPPSGPTGAAASAAADGYARGARILSVGIASTGIFTFAYFAVGSHVLPAAAYGAISLLWSVLFVVISIIYRPVEQLLSRTIADRRARGLARGHPLRVPLTVQGGFALTFLVVALALRGPIEDAFDGSATLYWVFVGATLAYAASYFARGYLAGHQWFGLYGGLVLFESVSRFCFPVAVAVGIASGQALLNAAVLTVGATGTTALAGVVFNALLITRAPLQLFQSVQTSLLPHLSGLEATEGRDAFARAIRVTILAIAGFAGAVAIGLLAIGPPVMDIVFASDASYGRVGLAVIALGMGFHLCAGTLNQAALARGRDRAAAGAWLVAAALFVAWMLLPAVDDQLVRAEVGYAGAAALLCALLAGLYARGGGPAVSQA